MTLPASPEPVLTLLYVPGDRPERVAKALASAADVVIIDLEDAVAPDHKAAARAGLPSALAGLSAPDGSGLSAKPDGGPRPVQVRINGRGSPWYDADVAALAALPAAVGVRVPKVESAEHVRELAEVLPGRELHVLIETALGVERAFDIASAHPQVAGLGLGEADLRSQLGVAEEAGLTFARSRLVVAAAAAGLPAPAMSVFANVRDLEGLAASCARGRSLGFLGRAAIHPAQLEVIVGAFRPTEADVAKARAVVERVEAATAVGTGTVVLDDGTFLDVAMVEAARRTIALAERA